MYEYKRRKEIIPTKLKGLPGEFTGGQKHRQRSETSFSFPRGGKMK